MPELPEVETVVRGLRSKIIGHKILDVRTNWPKIVKNMDFQKFENEIRNLLIEQVERKGKFIIIRLSGNKTIIAHLRMTGNFLVSSCLGLSKTGSIKKEKDNCTEEEKLIQDKEAKHLHLVFYLNKNKNLLFFDVRKFGTLEIFKNEKADIKLSKIGIDALSNNLSLEEFKKLLHLKNTEIKKFLLNQSFISGIGNIYADEILFDSKISPKRKTGNIKSSEGKKLLTSTKKILNKAIEYGGTSFSDFRNIEGKKEGTSCPRNCGAKIKKIVIAGRGTRICPKCQV